MNYLPLRYTALYILVCIACIPNSASAFSFSIPPHTVFSMALQKLVVFGLTPGQMKDIDPRLDLQAPIRGMIVEASAVSGESASPDKPLFTVADTERRCISMDLHDSDLPKIHKDQKIFFTLDAFPGRRFPGQVVAIGGEVDDRTRTVKAYAEVENVDGLLRARMFGHAEIAVAPAAPKLLIPKEALQNDGDCNLVFVSPEVNVFQARKVDLGAAYEGGYEVTKGLEADDKIVTRGSFLLKTEVLRGQMRAGRCPEK